MGLQNRETGVKYLRIKDGKFYTGKSDALEGPYDQVEGLVTNLRYKDEEYEGTPQRKMVVTLNDGSDTYQLSLNVETANYSSLVSFFKNVDLTKSLTLHPKMEVSNKEGKEVKRHSVLVSQDGVYAKGYFTKDNRYGMPDWAKVKVGAKIVTDKSATTEFLENFVNENFVPVVNGNKAVVKEVPAAKDEPVKATPKAKATAPAEEVGFVANEELPWD